MLENIAIHISAIPNAPIKASNSDSDLRGLKEGT